MIILRFSVPKCTEEVHEKNTADTEESCVWNGKEWNGREWNGMVLKSTVKHIVRRTCEFGELLKIIFV